MTVTVRTGRSIGEVLFVLVLVAIVGALLVPWMQSSRERSRQVRCQANLQAIATGLQNYQTTFSHFPVGTFDQAGSVCNTPVGFHHNWLSGLVAPMGLQAVSDAIDRDVSVYAPGNDAARTLVIPSFHCPASTHVPENMTDYAGCVGSQDAAITPERDGVFLANRFLTADDVADGMDYTVFVGEKLPLRPDHGWLSGTRSSLRNGRMIADPGDPDGPEAECRVGGFGSRHPGGAYLLMGSGRLAFFSDSTDPLTLRQLAARSDQGERADQGE